jgi:hypothetical protein
MLKRQMFGRAGLPLLRKRVLLPRLAGPDVDLVTGVLRNTLLAVTDDLAKLQLRDDRQRQRSSNRQGARWAPAASAHVWVR